MPALASLRDSSAWFTSRLRAVDQVAYVRFASVYRSFRDIEEFMDELKGLLDDHGPEAARRKRGRADDSGS